MTTKTSFKEAGFNEDYVENYNSFPEEVMESLYCILCSCIVNNPVECKECQSIFCKECWDQLKILGKGCPMRCQKSEIQKANQFVFDVLKKLKFKCPICDHGGLSYEKFLQHYNVCEIAKMYSAINKLEAIEKEKDEEINKIQKKIEDLKNNRFKEEKEIRYSQDELRKLLITNKLDINSKMALYQATISGNLQEFMGMINKGYPMLEEVSAQSFYWTPLHYAMHYGKMNIAFYILDKLQQEGKYRMAIQLESNDKRTPVLCLLKSNALGANEKKANFIQLCQKYQIYPDEHVRREIKNRNLEEIYKMYQNDM